MITCASAAGVVDVVSPPVAVVVAVVAVSVVVTASAGSSSPPHPARPIAPSASTAISVAILIGSPRFGRALRPGGCSGCEERGGAASGGPRRTRRTRQERRRGREREPGIAGARRSPPPNARERADDPTHEEDTGERDRELQREPEQERRRRQQPGHVPLVHEALEVLLAREAEGCERRHPARREPAEAPLLDGEPQEPDGREHHDDLGDVREVLVRRPGLRAGESVRERVRSEHSGRSDRRHQNPGEQAPTHVVRIMPARAAPAASRRTRGPVRLFRFLVPSVTFTRCAVRACDSASRPPGSLWRPHA